MVVLPAGMGFGDLLMHGPALEALRPERVVVEHRYLDLARRIGLAPDVVSGPCPYWRDHFSVMQQHALVDSAVTPRARLFAEWLGVDWPRIFKRPRGQEPQDYVAVFPNAFEPRRSLSCGRQVTHLLQGMGLRAQTIEKSVFAHLDELVDFIARSRAAVAVDSGPMHVAAVLGVPLVACFTHVAPQARLTWMGDGPRRMIVPPSWPDKNPPGELSPDAWGASIAASDVVHALVDLLEETDT